MRKLTVQCVLWGLLCVASAVLYLVHIHLFHDPRQMAFYLVEDLAFLPIQVLVVSLLIHRLLNWRDTQTRAKKVNMVISAFFSEVGAGLLRRLMAFDVESERQAQHLKVGTDWTHRDFLAASRRCTLAAWQPTCTRSDLGDLQRWLTAQRPALLRLLENPNILEHETFTELLWAVFHLAEELQARADLQHLRDTDQIHLNGDMQRVMCALVAAWLVYLEHLSRDYPYLFSMAVRTNPFDHAASVIVMK